MDLASPAVSGTSVYANGLTAKLFMPGWTSNENTFCFKHVWIYGIQICALIIKIQENTNIRTILHYKVVQLKH